MPSIARRITQFSKKEVDYLFQHARSRLKNRFFTVLSVARTQDMGRILIVTSRKVGNAPERNKLRRQIKAIFYQEKLFELSYDYAIIAYKNALQLSFDELKVMMLTAMKRSPESNNHHVTNK